MTKRGIKIVILFVLIIFILIIGRHMYKSLDHDKQTYTTDIYKHIPPKATKVIHINREYNIDELFVYDPSLSDLINILGDTPSLPIIIAQYKDGEKMLITKATHEQEKTITNYIQKLIALPFPPKVVDYKGNQVFIYSITEDKFIAYTFYKGLFTVSSDYKLIEDFINTDPENTFYTDEENREIIEKVRRDSPISMFIKLQKDKLAVDYTAHNDTIIMSGYLLNKNKNDSLSIVYNTNPHLINLPDNICVDSYEISTNNPARIKMILNKMY